MDTAEDAKDASTGNINTELAFRANAKQFFLTYPKCNLEKEELLKHIENLHGINHYVISKELHEDGTPHLHAYFNFDKKLNIKDCRHFDINGFHPNIETVRDRQSCIKYIKKDKNFIENIIFDNNPDNFIKRKKDYDAWIEHNTLMNLKEPEYPITFMGQTINKPDPSIKKRHFWIYGPPDIGKTYNINKTFKGLKVFVRPSNKYPYEQYDNEDIIIFDDIQNIRFDEIASITNTYSIKTPVYGDIRYFNKFYKLEHTRTVIVVSNKPPEYELKKAVEARFNIINLYDLQGEDHADA